MRVFHATCLALLLLGAPSSAEAPKAPEVVAGKVNRNARLEIEVPKGKILIVKPAFKQSTTTEFDQLVTQGSKQRYCVNSEIEGDFPVLIWYKGEDEDAILTIFKIGKLKPTPTPPPSPKPVPPPTPPTPPLPPPTPIDPSPFAEPGLRALYLYESNDLATYPLPILNALYDPAAEKYLNEKAVVGADGGTREFRKWDQHVKIAAETTVWKNAVTRARTKVAEYQQLNPSKAALPWVMVGNGKTGYEGPLLPEAKMLEILRKHTP